MKIFYRLIGVIVFSAKRVLAQKGLTLAILLGFTTATALVMSIPIYADAAYQRILEKDVITTDEKIEGGEELSASERDFSFLFRYIGSWNGLINWDRVQPLDTYMRDQAIQDINLPLKESARFFRTDYFPFVSNDTETYSGGEFRPLAWLSLAYLSNWESKVNIIEGTPPETTSSETEEPLNVWISQELATEIGLQIGEVYRLLASFEEEKYKAEIPVQIAGIWEIKDPDDPFWFYKPSEFRYVLLTKENDFLSKGIAPIDGELDLALWNLRMDNSSIHSRDVSGLIRRIAATRTRAGLLLPDTRLDISPIDRLLQYQRASRSLMIFLYILSIPLLVMILSFIGLVGGMSISQRQNEIAVLRSRGASVVQVLGFGFLESLLIGIISLILGGMLALYFAEFFGRVNSFLNFSGNSTIQVSITPQAIQLGLLTMGLAMLAQLLPTFTAARHTIITYKQELARQIRPPWWQRTYIDFLLLIPTIYGFYILNQQGGLNIPISKGMVTQDPFQNPLLVLVPALGIFAFTLLTLRILPLIMSLVSRFLALTPSIGLLAATRHLARTTGNYHAPIILLVLTLSLSTFTATLAQTLDQHLTDQVYYQTGADAKLIEFGEMPGDQSDMFAQDSSDTSFWIFLPVSEHLRVPEIQAATRVARADVTIQPPSGSEKATLIGIDRADFPGSAFWRQDFASTSLGDLMNQLALTSEGILVPSSLLSKYQFKPGDILPVTIQKLGQTRQIDFKIVGAFDYFPTWYPDSGPLLVGNLDYIFEQVGGEYPYEVWSKIAKDVDHDQVIEKLESLSLNVSTSYFSIDQIVEAQNRPERQGLFGLLSVGFTALALLTTLGFLLYAFFSFRRRFIELGILRAIGLSAWQMMVLLGVELAILLGMGLATGTILGIGVSNIFIPYLQVGTEQTAKIPPFLIQIDWTSVFSIYLLFVLLFALALIILSILLLRMKVFQAIKLGETV
jgi:putative ABC transport system permease protein